MTQPNNKLDLRQLLGNKAALEQLAKSREAQALAGLLTQGRDQASLQKIAQEAANGNTQQLGELIRSITSSPGGAQLLQRLSQSLESK